MAKKEITTIIHQWTEFSDKKTNIHPIETKKGKPTDGNSYQASQGSIFIQPHTNTLEIKALIQAEDLGGKKMKTENKTYRVVDTPATIKAEVEVDEEGIPLINEDGTFKIVKGTREVVKQENLSLSQWNDKIIGIKQKDGTYIDTTVGEMFCGDASNFIAFVENIQ